MPPIGFSCALKGSSYQQTGPAASTATTTDTTAPKTQTTSTTTPRLSAFFTEVVCTLGTTPPQTATSPPPNGGNGVIRTTTRRRHAASQPLMLQNPTATGMEGAGGTAGPGRGTGEIGRPSCEARGPQCPWAAGPGWTTGQRADRSSRRGRPKWAALTPPPAKFRMQFPRSTNQHKLKNRRISTIRTQTPTCAHGKCMRNCWLTAIAGHQGDAPNHTSAH